MSCYCYTNNLPLENITIYNDTTESTQVFWINPSNPSCDSIEGIDKVCYTIVLNPGESYGYPCESNCFVGVLLNNWDYKKLAAILNNIPVSFIQLYGDIHTISLPIPAPIFEPLPSFPVIPQQPVPPTSMEPIPHLPSPYQPLPTVPTRRPRKRRKTIKPIGNNIRVRNDTNQNQTVYWISPMCYNKLSLIPGVCHQNFLYAIGQGKKGANTRAYPCPGDCYIGVKNINGYYVLRLNNIYYEDEILISDIINIGKVVPYHKAAWM